MFQIFQANCLGHMLEMPKESIHLIITDPAYQSLEKHRAKGTTTRLKQSEGSNNEWFEIFPNTLLPTFFEQSHRILVPNSHLYVMCDVETLFVMRPAGEAAGFTWWGFLVWDKEDIGMGYHYRNRFECICFFEKGKRKLKDLSMPNIIRMKRVRGGYPTEKPAALFEPLISQSSDEGQIVFDPFMGSGSVGEAALRLKRRFHGCDLSSKSVSLVQQRLSKFETFNTMSGIP